MRLRSILIATGLLGSLTIGLAANAAASTLQDFGSYTLDTTTNLDWLDLDQTFGYSPNQILSNAGVNFVSQGWRYATLDELRGLFTDAGGADTVTNYDHYAVATAAPGVTWGTASLLEDLLGSGHSDNSDNYAFTGEPYASDNTLLTLGRFYTRINSTNGLYVAGLFAPASPGLAPSSIGYSSFLVRIHGTQVATTPIPASVVMLLTALGGLGLAGFRRKRSA